jgi:hypothetical protein
MTEEERKIIRKKLADIRQRMMLFSNTGHPDYIALAASEQALMKVLGESFIDYFGPFKTEDLISTFIVNQLGINLCAVKSINIDRQEDGQIKEIKIEFIPSNENN